jgi:hypothetical protein
MIVSKSSLQKWVLAANTLTKQVWQAGSMSTQLKLSGQAGQAVCPLQLPIFLLRPLTALTFTTRQAVHPFISLLNGMSVQGIQKGEVSLYHWPPVGLVWNQLYDNWQLLFLFAKQTNPNQSNRRSTVQWYFPLLYSLVYGFNSKQQQ